MEIISSRSRTVKSDESRGRQNIFMCLAALPCHHFLPIHEWRLGNIAIWILIGLMWCWKSFLLPWTFNPRTYTQSHTPTVVQGGIDGTFAVGFLICCNTSKRFCLQWKAFDLLYKMRPPSWILSRIRNQAKTVGINNFLRLTCKITQY